MKHFNTARDCIEAALNQGIDLSYVDLSNQDLRDINLDDAIIRHGNFRGADLRGANMSEGIFDHCDFSNAFMQGACLNLSSFQSCGFVYTRFGDTDCAGTNFRRSIFGGLSSFSLKFFEAERLSDVSYFHEDERLYAMTNPPVVIQGLKHSTIILDTHFLDGAEMRAHVSLYSDNRLFKGSHAPEYRHILLALAFETGRFARSA